MSLTILFNQYARRVISRYVLPIVGGRSQGATARVSTIRVRASAYAIARGAAIALASTVAAYGRASASAVYGVFAAAYAAASSAVAAIANGGSIATAGLPNVSALPVAVSANGIDNPADELIIAMALEQWSDHE